MDVYRKKKTIWLIVGLLLILLLVLVTWKLGWLDSFNRTQNAESLSPAPGSCLILEERHCFSGEGVVINGDLEAVGFRIPEGTPLFFPWEEGTFNLVSGGASSDGPLFSAVILFDAQSNYVFVLTGFQPGDELEGLIEDSKSLGTGELEGDILKQGMEIGSVSGELLEGYGDGTYMLEVLVGDFQSGDADYNTVERLFGVTR